MARYSCLFILLMSIAAATPAQQPAAFHRLMRTYHDYNMFDGAVLVAQEGKVVYQESFGMANREWSVPNTTDTRFMIGSISKPFTATLTLMMVQKGLLSLDSSLGHYLPAFQGKPASKVTVRQLLSHTSGMANYDIIKDFFPRLSRQFFSREDYLKVFIDSPLLFTPGSSYAYSSWGYFTLGYLLEKVSGRPYTMLMQDELFRRAGMTQSGSYAHTQVVPQRATGYDYSFGGYTTADFRDQSNTMGTGDLYSTVGDVFRFHTALSDGRLLNDTLIRLMFTPGVKPANYGFGWFNKPFPVGGGDSLASNFHLGMTDGFLGFLRRIPSTRTMVVILCNSSPTDFFGITNNLFRVLYGQPVRVKQPTHKKVETLIRDEGIQKAVVAYRKMYIDTAQFHTDWISMNFLAEQLHTLGRTAEAVMLSETNVALFPEKDLIQFTMGNLYLTLNRKEEAIKCYRKALQITPTYEEARNRLKALESGR